MKAKVLKPIVPYSFEPGKIIEDAEALFGVAQTKNLIEQGYIAKMGTDIAEVEGLDNALSDRPVNTRVAAMIQNRLPTKVSELQNDAKFVTLVDEQAQMMQGPPGEPGQPGQEGKSAYQIWLDQGHAGSAVDFLNYLQGQPGQPGKDAVGSPGQPGQPGSPGNDGKSAELRKTATAIQWRQSGGTWADLVTLEELRGPAGTPANMPTLAPVATSGSYTDLTNKPSLFSGAYADLTGKPALFSGAYTDLTGKPILFSGAYSDLTGKPALFSGSYADLSNKPTLFSGNYNDLANKPTIPTTPASDPAANVAGLRTLGTGAQQAAAGDHTHTGLLSTADRTKLNDLVVQKLYGAAGVVTGTVKTWTGTLVPTTAMGQTIDISSAGFTNAPIVQVIALRNVTDPMQVVNVALKSVTATQVAVNITQPNSATVAILGINVLSGGPSVAATPLTNITLHITAIGV